MFMIILGLFLFVLLIVAHEFGHFLVAKRNAVEAEEFGVGFPPKIYGRKLGRGIFKGYYSLNLLPLGGFVKLKGEHDADTEPGSYGAAKLPSKIKILLAGVSANLVIAVIMFMIVAWIGMPQVVDNQFNIKSDSKVVRSEVLINFVEPGSPAEKAGLKNGDIINSIGSVKPTAEAQLRDATKQNAGQVVAINYTRGNRPFTTKATLLTKEEVDKSIKAGDAKGYLGVGTSEFKLTRSTWSAPIVAVGTITQFTGLTLKGIGTALASLGKAAADAITGHGQQAKANASAASENVAGPVGIYAILRQGSTLGYQFVLFVIAILSLTLAIMNILPIPALDGGKVAVTLMFKLFKKKLLPKTEDIIHGTGFAVLMVLFVLITIVDVRRFL
jgi:regulator of sigma E protease